MTPPHDFEFQLGEGRYLRGHGWRGIVALALVLSAIVIAIWLGHPLLELLRWSN